MDDPRRASQQHGPIPRPRGHCVYAFCARARVVLARHPAVERRRREMGDATVLLRGARRRVGPAPPRTWRAAYTHVTARGRNCIFLYARDPAPHDRVVADPKLPGGEGGHHAAVPLHRVVDARVVFAAVSLLAVVRWDGAIRDDCAVQCIKAAVG